MFQPEFQRTRAICGLDVMNITPADANVHNPKEWVRKVLVGQPELDDNFDLLIKV